MEKCLPQQGLQEAEKGLKTTLLSILQSKAIFFILGAYFFILSHMASYGIF